MVLGGIVHGFKYLDKMVLAGQITLIFKYSSKRKINFIEMLLVVYGGFQQCWANASDTNYSDSFRLH